MAYVLYKQFKNVICSFSQFFVSQLFFGTTFVKFTSSWFLVDIEFDLYSVKQYKLGEICGV